MKDVDLSPDFARVLNFVGVMAMIAILLGAYAYQFSYRDVPCTLCLLQRVAMLAVATGAAMNLMLGPSPRYYGVCLVSALFGIGISIRQSLLHINPFFDTKTGEPTLEATANPPFGESVMGLNLYVWGVVIFAVVILAAAVMLFFQDQFKPARREPQWLGHLAVVGVAALLVVAALETLTTFLECGLGDCPNNGGWTWWIAS